MVKQRSLFVPVLCSLCWLPSSGATIVISGAGTVDKLEVKRELLPHVRDWLVKCVRIHDSFLLLDFSQLFLLSV